MVGWLSIFDETVDLGSEYKGERIFFEVHGKLSYLLMMKDGDQQHMSSTSTGAPCSRSRRAEYEIKQVYK